jgi:hypothetical protein
VLSRSTDAGQTWTPPTRVSAAESGQAFTPVAEVDSSGVLGVTYYDFTFDSPVDEPLRTDAWIVHSPDGGRSFETRQRLTPVPFDLRQAPEAGGFFVGDYTGLDAPDDGLQALYSITEDDAGDPTDVLAQRATASGGAARSPRDRRPLRSRRCNSPRRSPGTDWWRCPEVRQCIGRAVGPSRAAVRGRRGHPVA